MDHEKWLEQHDRMMADHEIMWARHDKDMAEFRERQSRLEASQDKTERTLRWAIRLAVQDARRQRKRNREFDEKMTQIASAQLVNEQLLKAFLERGGNGKH
jgi:hypothetical protein